MAIGQPLNYWYGYYVNRYPKKLVQMRCSMTVKMKMKTYMSYASVNHCGILAMFFHTP